MEKKTILEILVETENTAKSGKNGQHLDYQLNIYRNMILPEIFQADQQDCQDGPF